MTRLLNRTMRDNQLPVSPLPFWTFLRGTHRCIQCCIPNRWTDLIQQIPGSLKSNCPVYNTPKRFCVSLHGCVVDSVSALLPSFKFGFDNPKKRQGESNETYIFWKPSLRVLHNGTAKPKINHFSALRYHRFIQSCCYYRLGKIGKKSSPLSGRKC